MKNILMALALAVACTVPALAYTDLNVGHNGGSGGYSQTDVALVLASDSFSLSPKLRSWTSDDSSGTYTTYSVRAEYTSRSVKAGLEGGVQPKADGYDKKYGGADLCYSFYPHGESDGKLYLRLDLGVAAMFTYHSDEYQIATGGSGNSGAVQLRTEPFDLRQRDYTVFGGAGIGVFELSGDYTVTKYNTTILPTDRSSRNLSIMGLNHVTQGFLDNSWSGKVKLLAGPLRPYVSYTSIRLLEEADREKSYACGMELKLKAVKLRVSYELYKPGNGLDESSYYGGGATLLF